MQDGCGTNAMKKRGEKTRREQSRPRIAIQCAPKATSTGKPGRKRETRSSHRERALDPQFAKPAHVHPPSPIAHPFALRAHTSPDGRIAGTKSSTRDHDLPSAAALPG